MPEPPRPATGSFSLPDGHAMVQSQRICRSTAVLKCRIGVATCRIAWFSRVVHHRVDSNQSTRIATLTATVPPPQSALGYGRKLVKHPVRRPAWPRRRSRHRTEDPPKIRHRSKIAHPAGMDHKPDRPPEPVRSRDDPAGRPAPRTADATFAVFPHLCPMSSGAPGAMLPSMNVPPGLNPSSSTLKTQSRTPERIGGGMTRTCCSGYRNIPEGRAGWIPSGFVEALRQGNFTSSAAAVPALVS